MSEHTAEPQHSGVHGLAERLRHAAWVGHWSATAVVIPGAAIGYVAFLLSAFA